MKKITIKEAIVVEGRDDTAAIDRAVEAVTIETHGFGMSKNMWKLLEAAYIEKGLIIFTDPDYAGEQIRREILAKFPKSKEAFLSEKDASRKGDIGIENAEPMAIIEALQKARCMAIEKKENFTMSDLSKHGLTGIPESKEKREKLGSLLGIGYGNGKTLLKKLNRFSITREEFMDKVKEL